MASLVGGGGDGGNGGGRDELKTQFTTREGTYQLVSAVDFSRTTRPATTYVTSSSATTSPNSSGSSPPVRLSFVEVPCGGLGQDAAEAGIETGGRGSMTSLTSPTTLVSPSGINSSPQHSPGSEEHNSDLASNSSSHLFCFNMGKELLVYPFVGCKKIVDINKPIDKRGYKGTNPTCHDFNSKAATASNIPLLIGFSGGQIQYVDSMYKEVNKLFNEERVIDKTRVTCIHWLPNSSIMFLVAHASGHLYLYNADVPCGATAPHYQQTKSGPGYSVWNCKSKISRNPITRWTVGDGAINEFAFSPCGQFLAIVSQDGFLRIFKYETLDLVGLTRSYFGGLLCVGWSPDGNYICVGGEDDLVTLWSFHERRVVARGQGHKSWVAAVAFDPYATTYGSTDANETFESSNGGECNRNSHIECSTPGCVFSSDSVTSTAQSSSGSLCASCVAHQQLNNSSHSNSGVKHRNLINSTNNVISRNSVSSVNSKMGDNLRISSTSEAASTTRIPACYRVGSVGQDTQLCLWDLTEDVIKHFKHSGVSGKTRPLSEANSDFSPHSNSRIINQSLANSWNTQTGSDTSGTNLRHQNQSDMSDESRNSGSRGTNSELQNFSSVNSQTHASVNGNQASIAATNGSSSNSSNHGSSGHSILSLRFGALSFGSGDKSSGSKDKDHRRNFSLGSSKNDKNSNASTKGGGNDCAVGGASGGILGLGAGVSLDDPLKLIGTLACPRLDECPLLEPLVCKKISHERLTSLTFREESIVTACQDGIICTWARPGDVVSQL